MPVMQIPYNPAADPMQYWGRAGGQIAQGLNRYLGGLQESQDIQRLGGPLGMQSPMGRQIAMQQALTAMQPITPYQQQYLDIQRQGLMPRPLTPLQEAQKEKIIAEVEQIGKTLKPDEFLQENPQSPTGFDVVRQDLTTREILSTRPATRKETIGTVAEPPTLTRATTLRKEFDASKVFKNYQTVARSERSLNAAYKMSLNPDTKSKVASDQALAVLFQKMLDPDSVVRESEYARTPEGVGVINRLRGWIPKLRKGGIAVSDEDRTAIYEMSRKLLEGAQLAMNKHIDRYEKLSEIYQVDPIAVLGNIKKFDIGNQSQQFDYNKISSGSTYIDPDGVTRRKP